MIWKYVLDLLPAILAPFVGIAAALAIIVMILQWQGADAVQAWKYVYEGTLETSLKRADLVAYWMPLAITSFGLVLTYTAGLWNIGVEGQMIMGAVGGTWAIRVFSGESTNPIGDWGWVRLILLLIVVIALGWNGFYNLSWKFRRRQRFSGLVMIMLGGYLLLLLLETLLRRMDAPIPFTTFVCAAIAGGLWATLAALLKTRGGVNEIFGGVALNFIAQTYVMYLVSNGGPWQPVGSRATETARFPEEARLHTFEQYRRLAPTTIYVTIGGFIVVFLIMYISRWGLQLRAMGHNQRSAFLLGVRTQRNVVLAMAVCGAFAGIGGSFRVLAPDVNKLTATPSGGIGFLAILVVLLASMSVILTPVVSFVFAVFSKGGLRLESGFEAEGLTLHNSLVRVLQSTVVLMVVLAFGARNRFFPPRRVQPLDDEVSRT
jgi:simple sugar transport system permease protein